MQNRILYTLLGLVAAILVVRASVFTVNEGQLAIKSIGGEIVNANFEPGLHFRIPLFPCSPIPFSPPLQVICINLVLPP